MCTCMYECMYVCIAFLSPTHIHIYTQAAAQAKKKGDAYLAADQILLHLIDHPSVASALRQVCVRVRVCT